MNIDRPTGQENRRGIWQLDCLSICILLEYGIGPERLVSLLDSSVGCCRRHMLSIPARMLQIAHSACHSETEFSQEVTRLLNTEFARQISWVAQADWRRGVQDMAQDENASPWQLVGCAWALLGDPDDQRYKYGCYMIHDIFVRTGQLNMTDPAQGELATLEEKYRGLQNELATKQREIDDMLAYIHKTRNQIYTDESHRAATV